MTSQKSNYRDGPSKQIINDEAQRAKAAYEAQVAKQAASIADKVRPMALKRRQV